MKNLSYDEFKERVSDLAKARKIFIVSGITNNISVAFDLYQEILAEDKKKVFISRMNSPISDADRPRCGECNALLRLLVKPRIIDGESYPTTWVCNVCHAEYYTTKTAEEWMEELNDN
ncbi:Mut7-C RNAse domain-containing protein [Candidatus Micrarchaeota archaeon]|nr:Mut7-C RNAse domain-containing protein [Candidatus Micrarchaeota archaeon]